MQCPFCSTELRYEDNVELLKEAGIGIRMLFAANWRDIVRAELWRCPECGYLALRAIDEEGDRSMEGISPEVQDCPNCGARNFRRERCRVCGAELPGVSEWKGDSETQGEDGE